MTESKESLDKLALPQEYKMLAATAPTMFYHRNIEMLAATLPTKKKGTKYTVYRSPTYNHCLIGRVPE